MSIPGFDSAQAAYDNAEPENTDAEAYEEEEEVQRPPAPLTVEQPDDGHCYLLMERTGRKVGRASLLEPEDRDDDGDPWEWALEPGMHFRTRDEDGWNTDYGTAADQEACVRDLAQRIADYGLMDSNGRILY